MTVLELLDDEKLDKSLLVGYYGGGNFGDELLLEVLQNLFITRGIVDLHIAYQKPAKFTELHNDFGYTPVDIHNIWSMVSATLLSRNILIGGGGLWGVDINLTTFLLGPYLFFCRYILQKRIYLLGVGFYSSTNWLGRLGAWFSAKAANRIIGRDSETVTNFMRYTHKISQDKDIAWHVSDVDGSVYQSIASSLDHDLVIKENTIIVTLRYFRHSNPYGDIIKKWLLAQHSCHVIVMVLESPAADPESHSMLRVIQQARPDYSYYQKQHNPIGLYLFLRRHASRLRLIGPQFHIILVAQLAGIPFLPIIYDNKVRALFETLMIPRNQWIDIKGITANDVEKFV